MGGCKEGEGNRLRAPHGNIKISCARIPYKSSSLIFLSLFFFKVSNFSSSLFSSQNELFTPRLYFIIAPHFTPQLPHPPTHIQVIIALPRLKAQIIFFFKRILFIGKMWTFSNNIWNYRKILYLQRPFISIYLLPINKQSKPQNCVIWREKIDFDYY